MLRPLFSAYFLDFRNNLTRFVYHDRISDSNIQIIDKILVVQSSTGYRCPAQTHRFKNRCRCDSSGSSNGKFDIQKFCFLLLRRIFVCDRPTWYFGCRPQNLTVCNRIDLYDRTINIIRQVSSVLTNLADGIPDLICSMTDPIIINNRNPLLFQIFIPFHMGFELPSTDFLHIKNKHRQIALFCNAAVQLTQRTCRTVSRICKCLFPKHLLCFVYFFKIRILHIDFSTDFNIRQRIFHLFLYIMDYFRIGCYIFSLDDAVSSGHRQF